MSQQLCSVCSGIPEEFWSRAYDMFESRMEIKAKLQPYHLMEKQKNKGCQLCTLLLESAIVGKLRTPKECLYLWRDYSDPHRAFCLRAESFSESLGTLYFMRVPTKWCRPPLASLNESIDNVHLMKTWLQTRKISGDVSLKQTQQFLPTRLLDVQAFQKSNDVRLVRCQDIRTTPTPPYLALSHCWGGNVPIQLQEESLDSWLTTGIPFKTLPKTFRDAVEITKQLDVRYLWVDSMCIIQDSAPDWTQEASLMAEVYGNAHCTLAALSSKNSSEGCQINANIQMSLSSPYMELNAELYQTSRIRIFSKKPQSWIEEFNGQPARGGGETHSPLRTRAWVLQEKELSNCTIYFAKGQLLWENGSHRGTAQVPWQELKPETRSETPRLMQENMSRQLVAAQQYPWYELVEDYTSRTLSFPTDKLVAFSGLAKKFSGGRKQYCAGMWSTDLPGALLWCVKDTATRPAYLAPSWSWASLMGSVTYDSLRLEADNDSAQYEYPEDVYPGLKTLKVQDVKIDLVYETKPYGEVHEGRIVLSGARCIDVECGSEVVRFSDGGQSLTQRKAPIGVFYPDVAEEIAASRETYCIALQSESVRSFSHHQFRLKQDGEMVSMVMGIVVARHRKNEGYRRLGLARWIDESLFDAVRTTTIELV